MNRIPFYLSLLPLLTSPLCTNHIVSKQHDIIPEIQEIELCAFPADGGSFYWRLNRNGIYTYRQSGFGEKREITKNLNQEEIGKIWESLKNLDSRYFADNFNMESNVKGTSEILFYSNSKVIGGFVWEFQTYPKENTINNLLRILKKNQ